VKEISGAGGLISCPASEIAQTTVKTVAFKTERELRSIWSALFYLKYFGGGNTGMLLRTPARTT
jgi:hypothetical protein